MGTNAYDKYDYKYRYNDIAKSLEQKDELGDELAELRKYLESALKAGVSGCSIINSTKTKTKMRQKKYIYH